MKNSQELIQKQFKSIKKSTKRIKKLLNERKHQKNQNVTVALTNEHFGIG